MTRNSLMAASIAVVVALIGVAAWVGAMLPGDLALPGHLVKKDRRALELVQDKDDRPHQQNQELHRNLEHGIEHQAQPALPQRGAMQVALHL